MHFMEYIDYHMDTFPMKPSNWNYEDGCVMQGCIQLYQVTGRDCVKAFVAKYIEDFIGQDGSIRSYKPEEYNLDNINTGRALFFLYEETGDEKYKKAIELLRQQIEVQPRTNEGNFWHKAIYPWQVWLDGLYMAQPFYVMYEREYGKKDYSNTIKQFQNVRRLMFNTEKSLYYHGYDESRTRIWADKDTGLSANFWLRAMGWYLIALVDTIEEMREPESEGTRILTEIFCEAADGILKYQDPQSRLFYQVIDKPEVSGNYLETSGSAMVACALIKGSRLNVLSGDMYAIRGEEILMELYGQKLKKDQGYYELTDICKVAGLGPHDTRDGSVEYYLSEPVVKDDHKGSGAFIMAYAQLLMDRTEQGGKLEELL